MMRRAMGRIAAAVAVLLAVPTAAQEKMVPYQLVLLKKGPNAPATPPGPDDPMQKQHLAYLEKLNAEGVGVAIGAIADGSDLRGIAIMKTATAEQARQLAEADATVKAGRHAVEIMTFLSPEGWFRKPAKFLDVEQVYFGFLVEGPDRTQDAETAQRLQKEHLAYMNGQFEQGRLRVAGPITANGGTRRGIVVYRAASLDEARRYAEGDPMVKAGRLAVVLHPWFLSKGILP